ncbi:protein containing DUF255 [Candidatus Magnetomorum sp. HK-1]|nr:protein containing DUF255 [Candidatus Magnetomorum sp. HK-1]
MNSNLLIHEKSPYLVQHAYNPVKWYPWGERAFTKAVAENKPIFLSIGYATCHWCHVMEKESFENIDVAKLMNDAFVCIKVDREERPDIDSIYMKAAQMMSGASGWPLTIVMSPEKKPFFAATYIPKETRFGRIGMLDLIPRIKSEWQAKETQILVYSNKVTQMINQRSHSKNVSKIDDHIIKNTISQLSNTYDSHFGGFGKAPKFPSSHILSFLLQSSYYNKNHKLISMVENTLHKMRLGGIYDQIGCGFHRYSTDKKWFLPHFEKMLYDQAMLSYTYLETYLATGNRFYADVAKEIFTYVLRDMTSKQGAFFSAEDADSDGVEGKYYIWSMIELQSLLSEKECQLVVEIFNVTDEGNFYEEATGKVAGTNILFLNANLSEKQKNLIAPISKKLFNERMKRNPPLKDTKILTDWNALMIASFSKGARVLCSSTYKAIAIRAMNFLCQNMLTKNNQLMHRYKDGDIAINGKLDDYAFMIHALLELYETTFDVKYLEIAIDLNTYVLKHFWDNKNKGFFGTSDDDEKLIARPKDAYDGAIPSGNAVYARNLMKLSKITGDMSYEKKAEELMWAFSDIINRAPTAFTQMLMAYQFANNESYEIVISGNKESNEIKEILNTIQVQYLPDKIFIFKDETCPEKLSKLAKYTKNQKMIHGKTTLYICKGQSCERPLTDFNEILDRLKFS